MATERNAEQTRTRILEAACEEIYLNGYQGMRIDAILHKTQLAKGALYHHFPNKLSLAYAVVEEILRRDFEETWNNFISEDPNPLTAMKKLFAWKAENLQQEGEFNGCPVNNLSQEMSALDEGFQQRLKDLVETVISSVAAALSKGQEDGFVRRDINPRQTALFMHCCYQGIMGTVKCMQSTEMLPELFASLSDYVDQLGSCPACTSEPNPAE